MKKHSQWLVYILRCADGTLYTGITTDLTRRLAMHEAGKGAKYTKGRTPLAVVFTESHPSRSHALRRENELKKLKRIDKLEKILKNEEF